MKRLYFIRHGESVGNIKMLFTGRWDAPLTDLGREQAAAAASGAQSLDIDCIVSSPLIRAKETAQIIADAIGYPKDKIQYSDLFMERDYGDLQQQPYESADGIDFEKVPNIELLDHLEKRGQQAVDFLNRLDADNILIVAHGTIGRVLRQKIRHISSEEIEVPIEQEIPNAQIVRWI